MTLDDRAAAIERLRAFAQQQGESKAVQERGVEVADRGSMARAADVVALFDEGTWVKELDPPKRRPGRRGAQADSFNRFCKWAEAEVGLKRSRLNQLRQAHDLRAQISTAVDKFPESEWALRSLVWMTKNHYGDRIPEVWAAAVERAGGEHPSSADVRAALTAWKRENVSSPTRTSTRKSTKRSNARTRAVADVDDLVKAYLEDPGEVGPLVDTLAQRIEALRAEVPNTVDELVVVS